MSKQNEAGIARNVGNFELLVDMCRKAGTKYNPSVEELSLDALQSTLDNVRAAMATVDVHLAAQNSAIAKRQVVYEHMRQRAARVVNHISITGTEETVQKEAKALLRRIRGRRASRAPQPDVNAADKRSTSASQASFDSLQEHFARLVEVVRQQPKYKPNEAELTVKNLATLLEEVRNCNTKVIDTANNLAGARQQREHLLYDPTTGAMKRAAGVKKYFKTLYPVTSPEYRAIGSIPFRSRNITV